MLTSRAEDFRLSKEEYISEDSSFDCVSDADKAERWRGKTPAAASCIPTTPQSKRIGGSDDRTVSPRTAEIHEPKKLYVRVLSARPIKPQTLPITQSPNIRPRKKGTARR